MSTARDESNQSIQNACCWWNSAAKSERDDINGMTWKYLFIYRSTVFFISLLSFNMDNGNSKGR